jgi:GAF domain-containing protein
VIIHDAYADERFQKAIDLQTGYTTSRILCVPLRTLKGDLIGVAQLLNKEGSEFTEHDLKLLEAIVAQAAVALESHRTVENLQAARRQELEFLDVNGTVVIREDTTLQVNGVPIILKPGQKASFGLAMVQGLGYIHTWGTDAHFWESATVCRISFCTGCSTSV